MRVRFIGHIVLFLTISINGYAQLGDRALTQEQNQKKKGSSVLDDSTKQIYGPNTTSYRIASDLKYNLDKVYNPDTTIIDFHRYQFIAQNNNTFQNQGNIGTPIASIYPLAPDIIGARLGFTQYDMYFPDPERLPIYNTLSPYSKFGIIWGGQGRSITNAEFTRNIDSRSNFGFVYRGLLMDKQVERERRGDRQALSTYYAFNANYATKNGKYFITGNFSRNHHEVADYGGVFLDEDDTTFLAYFEDNRQANLTEAGQFELRTNYHVYQHYKFNDKIQLYHSHDRYKQLNDFTNEIAEGSEANADFFDQVVVDSIPIKDRSKIIYRQHEVGLKGDIGKTFYSLYYRGREVNLDFKYIEEGNLDYGTYYMENYGGFNLRFGNDSVSYIAVAGEYLDGENYNLEAEIKNSWFYAKGRSARYLPNYTQRAYRGRHREWFNDLESTINTKLETGLKWHYKGFTLEPSISYNLISDYVYFTFTDSSLPQRPVFQSVQESGDVNIVLNEIKLRYDFWKHFTFKSQLILANVSGSDAVQLPSYLFNAQLAYSNILYDGNLHLQTGIDFHQRAAYFANGYDPSSMQFYVQNEFEVNEYPLIDIFFNAKVNRGRLFIKWNNVVELFTLTGYFTTPYYPGQRTVFDLGLDWLLFD